MPNKTKTIQVVEHDGYSWGVLKNDGRTQILSAESVSTQKQNYTLFGGHRVRLYKLEKNVCWRLPAEAAIDISQVAAADPPRRKP